MATDQECVDASERGRHNIFQEMRAKLIQKFTEFDRLLTEHRKKLELKIDQLELEYTDKQQQIESDKQTLAEVHEQTQSKLSRNSLLEVQSKILSEISNKLRNLNLECTKQEQLRFTLYWNHDEIIGLLNNIDLELTPATVPEHDNPPEKSEDTIPKDTATSLPEYPDTYFPQDTRSISPHSSDPSVYFDSYNSWNGHYRDKRDPRGHRGGRRRDKYAYDNNYTY